MLDYLVEMSDHLHKQATAVRIALAVIFLGAFLGCAGKVDKEDKLIIFHAGSLSVPFARLSAAFQQRHPGVEVLAEAAGSRDCARKVTELRKPCDVLGSSDYRVVEELLQPAFADFNILFATNEMTIAFTERSREADRITSENWARILEEETVTFGRSDPNSDPCGYRTLMLFQLAERYYRVPGLCTRLEKRHGQKFIRPKETDLLALLEAGEIDYLFIYKSVAVQHRLQCLDLPREINLGQADQASVYRHARVKIVGSRPGSQVEMKGEPIFYSVTIPRNAPKRELAAAWVALLLSPEGQAILSDCGQRPVVPAPASGYAALPEVLRELCRPHEIAVDTKGSKGAR